MWFRFALAAALSGAADIAAAQSFDCAKAQTRVEKMVCADRAIAELDEYLGRYPRAGLRSDQQQGPTVLRAEPLRVPAPTARCSKQARWASSMISGQCASRRKCSGKSYTDRIATIGCTDAARRAGARLASTATSTAIAGPTT